MSRSPSRRRTLAQLFVLAALATGCAHERASADASPPIHDLGHTVEFADVTPSSATIIVLDERQKQTAQLHIESTASSTCGPSVRIEFAPVDGPTTVLLADAIPSGARGELHVGEHHASWRVAIDPSGHARGQRWRTHSRPTQAERLSLSRALALTPALTDLIDQTNLPASADDLSHLAELTRFATFALDTSARASTRTNRANL